MPFQRQVDVFVVVRGRRRQSARQTGALRRRFRQSERVRRRAAPLATETAATTSGTVSIRILILA